MGFCPATGLRVAFPDYGVLESCRKLKGCCLSHRNFGFLIALVMSSRITEVMRLVKKYKYPNIK